MQKLVLSTIVLIPILSSFSEVVAQAKKDHPNVIIILTDDFGWKDMSCYGIKYFETPAIDRLVGEGVRFKNISYQFDPQKHNK